MWGSNIHFQYIKLMLHGILHACGRGMTYKNFIDCGCMNVLGLNTINASINSLLPYISYIIITLIKFSK